MFEQNDLDIPIFDTTQIHAAAAAAFTLNADSNGI